MQKSYVFSHSILCIHAVKTMYSLGQNYVLTLLKRNFEGVDVALCDRLCGTCWSAKRNLIDGKVPFD